MVQKKKKKNKLFVSVMQESNGKLPHLFIPSKTAVWVPEFLVEDLSLRRTSTFVLEFAAKDLPLCIIL